MKKSSRIFLVALLSLALVASFALFGCSSQPAAEENNSNDNATEETHEAVQLQIFAANSLTKAMDEVQTLYTKDHDWITFADTQYKSSGELNELLTAGSYADLLISASSAKMDEAEEGDLTDPVTRIDMFTNELVIVSKTGSGLTDVTLEDIASSKYTVAVGDDSVPAGNYAAQALSTVGAYKDVDGKTGAESTGKGGEYVDIKPLLDTSVGNVCQHAASGEVDVAIVYSSDVFRFEGVEVVGKIADDTHKPIVYPGAVLTESKYSQETKDFLEWCVTNEDALKIWEKWGFELA